jgi:hypothetical protein
MQDRYVVLSSDETTRKIVIEEWFAGEGNRNKLTCTVPVGVPLPAKDQQLLVKFKRVRDRQSYGGGYNVPVNFRIAKKPSKFRPISASLKLDHIDTGDKPTQ